MESVPKDGREEDEHDDREDEIIEKLPDKRGDVGSCGIGKLAVGMLAKRLSNRPIQGVIDNGRCQKCKRTAEQDKPRAAEDFVKYRVIARIGGNDTCYEKDEAGE